MMVGNGPLRPMRTESDLKQLYLEMLAAWQMHKAKQKYSQCLPALLKPSNERSMDERHLVVWCVDSGYKTLGTYFPVLQPQSEGHTAADAMAVFDICGHYIFDSMFALTDKSLDNPLEAPVPFGQFAKLWTFSEADQQLVIDPKTATTRHLSKGFPLVGAQLKKTPEGRAILSGADGKDEAHHYYSGHRTKNGGKTKRRKARVVPTFSTEEQDVRYLGSHVWADMHKELCRGGRSCSTTEMLDYIRGPHVPPAAKQKLIEHGVWREFEEMEEDNRKISVDHIVPHDWGATDHPMNYFLLPKGLNSQFNARGVLCGEKEGEGPRVLVTKKQVVGMHAFHTAVSFHRMSLAVQHGFLMVEEAMEIARRAAAQLVQAAAPPPTGPPGGAVQGGRKAAGNRLQAAQAPNSQEVSTAGRELGASTPPGPGMAGARAGCASPRPGAADSTCASAPASPPLSGLDMSGAPPQLTPQGHGGQGGRPPQMLASGKGRQHSDTRAHRQQGTAGSSMRREACPLVSQGHVSIMDASDLSAPGPGPSTLAPLAGAASARHGPAPPQTRSNYFQPPSLHSPSTGACHVAATAAAGLAAAKAAAADAADGDAQHHGLAATPAAPASCTSNSATGSCARVVTMHQHASLHQQGVAAHSSGRRRRPRSSSRARSASPSAPAPPPAKCTRMGSAPAQHGRRAAQGPWRPPLAAADGQGTATDGGCNAGARAHHVAHPPPPSWQPPAAAHASGVGGGGAARMFVGACAQGQHLLPCAAGGAQPCRPCSTPPQPRDLPSLIRSLLLRRTRVPSLPAYPPPSQHV